MIEGESRIAILAVETATSAMLVNTGPIFIALFAGLFLREGFPSRLVLGLGVAFVGTLLIGFASSSAPAASSPRWPMPPA